MSDAAQTRSAPPLEVAILGSGFSGLCMAMELRRAGIEGFALFERADGIGGTWRDNTYPGCACDIPSHLYSFSFEPNPDWSKRFPPQHEILAYLERCADKYNIRPHVHFQTEIVEARFDEQAALWRLRSRAGERFAARVLVTGTGPLSNPALPALPGLADFEGPAFHSARWDHAVELGGKRVAVVGTGASAIQFVPRIAPQVQRLHLFQRTPPWVVPRGDRPFARWQRWAFAHLPGVRRAYRASIYAQLELRALGFLGHRRFQRLAERVARQHIADSIRDPTLHAKVTPDYAIGCKRILISDDYYPALERPNVELVTEPIERVTPGGVVSADGRERPVDAILFGTGFTATDFLAPLHVYGLGGRELTARWREHGAETHLGITAAGFPNFFMLVGPNTGLGHNSMVFMIEAQVRYVLRCLGKLQREGLRWLDVRPAVQHAFGNEVQQRMGRTVWLSGCRSWYLDEKGRNYTLWPGFTFAYWARTRRLREGDFQTA